MDAKEVQKMKSLQENVAIVTGASSGIGRATAIALAQHGALVVASDCQEDLGEETVSQIKNAGGSAVFQKTDVSNSADIQALVQRTIDTFGRLDIAFNNVGIVGPINLLAEQSEEDFDRVFEINVKGVYMGMKYQIKQMLTQGSGVIVNTISTSGFRNFLPGQSIYTATKHALVGLTKTTALEYAESGIRINAVAPGPTDTKGLVGGSIEQFAERLPMKRIGKPEEIASAVLWLCSDAASFVTGHTLVIDGGFLCG